MRPKSSPPPIAPSPARPRSSAGRRVPPGPSPRLSFGPNSDPAQHLAVSPPAAFSSPRSKGVDQSQLVQPAEVRLPEDRRGEPGTPRSIVRGSHPLAPPGHQPVDIITDSSACACTGASPRSVRLCCLSVPYFFLLHPGHFFASFPPWGFVHPVHDKDELIFDHTALSPPGCPQDPVSSSRIVLRTNNDTAALPTPRNIKIWRARPSQVPTGPGRTTKSCQSGPRARSKPPHQSTSIASRSNTSDPSTPLPPPTKEILFLGTNQGTQGGQGESWIH